MLSCRHAKQTSKNVADRTFKIEYPPQYECLVWDFKRADVNAITAAINQSDWKFMFSYKNVHQQVNIFKTAINIFSNFIPNKLVTFSDKDPPCITEKLKDKVKTQSISRDYLKNGKMYVHYAITEVPQFISESKDEYYNKLAMKVNNPKSSSKTY